MLNERGNKVSVNPGVGEKGRRGGIVSAAKKENGKILCPCQGKKKRTLEGGQRKSLEGQGQD